MHSRHLGEWRSWKVRYLHSKSYWPRTYIKVRLHDVSFWKKVCGIMWSSEETLPAYLSNAPRLCLVCTVLYSNCRKGFQSHLFVSYLIICIAQGCAVTTEMQQSCVIQLAWHFYPCIFPQLEEMNSLLQECTMDFFFPFLAPKAFPALKIGPWSHVFVWGHPSNYFIPEDQRDSNSLLRCSPHSSCWRYAIMLEQSKLGK